MEITIDRSTLYVTFAMLAILALLGLAALGRSFSPLSESAGTRVLTWNDWQLVKAQRRFESERVLLRSDVDQLAALLNQAPDPVAAQLLAQRIGQRLATGEPALQPARTALLQAAQAVAGWSAGASEPEAATASVQAAAELLK